MTADVIRAESCETDQSFQRTCIEIAGTFTGVILALVVIRTILFGPGPLFDVLLEILGGMP